MDRLISLEARSVDLAIEPPFQLGRARVDPQAHEYVIGGKATRIQPQTLKVLIALHDKSGQVVTRDELIDRCWGGRIVGDDVINRCISLLRPFASESGGFRIETVPRAGYRLIEEGSPRKAGRRRWLIVASAAALFAIIAVGVGLWQRSGLKPAPAPATTPTIALLPFTANSADADARRLAAATRAAVANTLSEGEYAVQVTDAADGPGPSSDFLISGELTMMPDKAVESVRMEEERHHVVVFSHQFEADRAKAWSLPEEVGAQVAAQLSWTAPLVELERRHPSDPAVTRQLFEESASGLQGAGSLGDYEMSRRLALANPNSPLAQNNLAYNTAFALDQLPLDEREAAVELGRLASDRAIALAPEFGEPYAPWCMLHSEVRAVECEARLRKAMRVDPDAPFPGWFLASLVLNPVGRDTEAAELASVSLAHDPFMPNKIGLTVQMLEVTGRTVEAEQLYLKSTGWWPGEGAIVWRRFAGMIERGDFEAARRFDVDTHTEPGAAPVLLAVTRGGVAGVRNACAKAKDFESTICMLALAHLGDLGSAFILADKLYPPRRGRDAADQNRIWLRNPWPNSVAFLTGPSAAPLRRDPRFIKLADGLGLLDYWRSGRLPDFCTEAHEPECRQIAGR
jgi:DNA-binding winged helix-turn-helix (wHTH) protein